MEFLLYDLIPIFLTILIFSRNQNKAINPNSLGAFFTALLFFPTIWFLNLLTVEIDLLNQTVMVVAVCIFLWFLVLGLKIRRWKISESSVLLAFSISVIGYFVLLLIFGLGPVPIWKKIMISLYRTSTVHIFYLFTSVLAIFVFFENIKNLSEEKKYLGIFLVMFLFTHFAIFAYANPKWSTIHEFVFVTFSKPGNSVNLSDTRGMMSFYPIFIFFISSLSFVRQRLNG